MSNPYTAAQEEERLARGACGRPRSVAWPAIEDLCLSGLDSRALCLAAAEACEALASACREMETECEGSLLLRDTAAAIAEDYAARAEKWRKVAGGESA